MVPPNPELRFKHKPTSERFEDEGPQHTVHLTLGFQIAATPVTQGLWASMMVDNPSNFRGDDRPPVEKVSWFDAVLFCNALSDKMGLEPVYEIGDGEKPDVTLVPATSEGLAGYQPRILASGHLRRGRHTEYFAHLWPSAIGRQC